MSGQVECKPESLELCPRPLFREALFTECSFSRNVGECAERVMKTNYILKAESKADLTLKM